MALGALFIVFLVMSLIGIAGIVLLFCLKNEKAVDVILILLTVYSLIIAFLGSSAQPTNYMIQKMIHWLIAILALLGLGIRYGTKTRCHSSKILVSVSVIGGMYFLYFG